MSKIIEVPVADLLPPIWVREKENRKHVEYLAMLIASGKELEPIVITQDRRVVDGWHRCLAHKEWDMPIIKARVIETSSEIEQIEKAFQANLGGALPPNRDDYLHTAELLVQRGAGKLQYAMTIFGLPAKETKRILADAYSLINKRKVTQAAHAVLDEGMSIPEAAKRFGAKEEVLRRELGGKRKKLKSNFQSYLRRLESSGRSYSMKNIGIFQQIQEDIADGSFTQKNLDVIIERLRRQIKQFVRVVDTYEERLMGDLTTEKGGK